MPALVWCTAYNFVCFETWENLAVYIYYSTHTPLLHSDKHSASELKKNNNITTPFVKCVRVINFFVSTILGSFKCYNGFLGLHLSIRFFICLFIIRFYICCTNIRFEWRFFSSFFSSLSFWQLAMWQNGMCVCVAHTVCK